MNENSLLNRILLRFASLLTRFFSDSTHDWAERKVEKIEASGLSPELESDSEGSQSIQDNTLWIAEDESGNAVFTGDRRDRGLTALVIAVRYRATQYWSIMLLPIALLLLPLNIELNPTIIGIYFNLFGAIIVVRGLYRTPEEVDRESSMIIPTGFRGSPEDRLVAAVETIDSMIGSLLLVLGFALQLLDLSSLLFTLAILVLVLIVWLGLRR